MSDQNRPPDEQGAAEGTPAADDAAPPPGAVDARDRDLPWKATAERRDLWGPLEQPLEGTVQPPPSAEVARTRGRSPVVSVGVPVVVGGLAGLLALLISLGLAGSLVGVLGALIIGLGVGVVAGGGTGLALRATRAAPARRIDPGADIPEGTRELLEKILAADAVTRERTADLRGSAPAPQAGPVLDHVDALLRRIDALVTTETVQSRRPSDGDVMMLEGMAVRYLPDLVDDLEDTVRFLASFEGGARERSLVNLTSIDEQLDVLGDGLEGIEQDVVSGVSRSLEVHHEFLRHRFADRQVTPLSDL